MMLIGQKMLGPGIFKYANKYWSRIISESNFTSIQEHMSVFWIYQITHIFFYFYFFCTIILRFTVRRMKNTLPLVHKFPQYFSSVYRQLYPFFRFLG